MVLYQERRREENMMPTMMFGMASSLFLWLVLATLLCLLLIGTCIWLVAGRLQKQRTPLMQDTPQPRDAYEEYEQGYQPQGQPPITDQEGGQHSAYPPHEHSNAQYQEMEQIQH
jgi:hypothetical protein